jgi:glyoxylase-like metal-dependent hydrolase (beta-lactamase superfamily II)
MLTEVADRVWLRQSEWVWTNSIVVRGDEGLIVVDPGIHGAELEDLADEIERLAIPVVAGFHTHPHFDHLLWHPRLGDVPRYATADCAALATAARDRARQMAAEEANGAPLDFVALVTPLPGDGGPLPGELIEHRAHAVGHAALLLADRRVLLAGDMLSDILVPIFDFRQEDQPSAYEAALAQLEEIAAQVDVAIPGHGSVATGPEITERLTADRAYVEAMRRGEEPDDPRLEQDWVRDGPHQGNLRQVRS